MVVAAVVRLAALSNEIDTHTHTWPRVEDLSALRTMLIPFLLPPVKHWLQIFGARKKCPSLEQHTHTHARALFFLFLAGEFDDEIDCIAHARTKAHTGVRT